MINNDNLMPTNVSNIISDFSKLVRNFSMKETSWHIQKEEYEKRISELEGEVKAHENINIYLLKRIRMLEYALSQERQKNNTNNNNEPSQLNKNNMMNIGISGDVFNDLAPQQLLKEEDLQFLKESANRPSLLSVLQSIGIDENLAKNLFDDFELNKTELEQMIKKNLDEKIAQATQETNNVNSNNNTNNNEIFNITNQLKSITIKNNNTGNVIETNSPKNNTNSMNYRNVSTFSFDNHIELRSHLDEVRKLTYLKNLNSLVSVGEDCLIKVWSLNNIFSESQFQNIEPYLTLRGHTGPLFCTEKGINNSNLVYTAGNEGIIYIWSIPEKDSVDQYGESQKIFCLNVGFFQHQAQEIIWDLKHHPTKNILVSLSSNSLINFWKTTSASEFMNLFVNEHSEQNWLIDSKTKKHTYSNDRNPAIPTCCLFSKTNNNKLHIGFNDATISTMDIDKGVFTLNYNILSESKSYNSNRVLSQPNAFVSASTVPLVYVGLEIGSIVSIDERNSSGINTVIKTAHSDAVTSLNLLNEIYLFSTSHDNTIKMWDSRKFSEPVISTVGSQKKWDEAILDSVLIENNLMLCVACADSNVKIYKL